MQNKLILIKINYRILLLLTITFLSADTINEKKVSFPAKPNDREKL